MPRLLFAALAAAVMTQPLAAADKRPMTFDDLMAFKRVADPQISPNGTQVVYEVNEILDVAANKKQTHLWIAATDGKTPPRQLTSSGKRDAHARWSPDGSKVLFESTRSGTSQLYILDLQTGGEAKKVTDISTGASTAIWSPDGNSIAFVSAVHPEFSELPFAESDKKNKEKDEAAEKGPVKAKTFTKLFYRHWDSYVEDKRQHLFVIKTDGTDCRDVTPGDRDAYPTSTTFSVGDDFTFTPDSKYLVFTAVPTKGESWTTNYELCRVSTDNKAKEWETLTKDNPAADGCPRYSPNGQRFAYRAQKKPGYEADKWDILWVDCNKDGTFDPTKVKNLTADRDLSVDDFTWVDSGRFQFTADSDGRKGNFAAHIDSNEKIQAFPNASYTNFTFGNGGKAYAFLVVAMDRPAEVYGTTMNGTDPVNLSKANDTLLAQLDRTSPESVRVKVEDGEMQMWVLKPPGFDDKKKWPVVYLVHGGPQGAWEDAWSFRWNAQLWAAQGYVIAMPNPRGSTGFGQKFVDEISADWGGKCYRDLVAGLEYMKKLPYADKDRMGSAGGSFGGYMQNWFAVNDIAKEFKCLITHCSVWNFESMWGTTDELWFDEWEHQGLPWEKPGKYGEFSPNKKAGNLSQYRVPMLIVHNDLDFRCPIGQGHELFSALQRQGVESRFVNFPDEGHWVLKPANSKHWHKEVFSWLTKYVPPGGK